ncbi:hypothetical protein ACFQ9Y_17005 [Peribacillus simplex]|uniref:hypothetical protein n=1 Tax=Peribacillus simplex TaxID=1478 RepID=UPI003671CFFD
MTNLIAIADFMGAASQCHMGLLTKWGLNVMTKSMNKLLSKIDAAIIILILTAVCYGIAYVYQMGYKRYYGLPYMFIDLNVNTITPILSVFFTIILVLYAVWKFVDLSTSFLKYIPIKFVKKLFEIKPRSDEDLTDIEKTIVSISKLVIFFLTPIIVGITLMNYGQAMASNKDAYMVIKQKEGLYVEISSYKDSIIIAPLDLEKESITPKFKAIETKELKDAETIHFENGLKVEDVRNSKDLME